MHTKFLSRFATGMLVSALAVATSEAATYSWNVAGPSDFNTLSNWTPALASWATGDFAQISNGGTATLTSNTTIDQLWVGQNGVGTGTGTLNQTGGALVLGAGLVVGRQGSAVGTYSMTGGSISTSDLRLGGGNPTVTSQGTMTVNNPGTSVTTGNVSSTGALGYVGIGSSGTGNLTIQNSATWTHGGASVFLVGGDNNNGGGSTAGGTGTLNITSGGSLGFSGAANLSIGRSNGTGGNGTVIVNGGSLSLGTGVIQIASSTNGGTGAGSGTLTLASGTISSPAINLNEGSSTVNFNGGNATIGGITKLAAKGSGTVNFNGGTITASAASSNFYNLSGTGTGTLTLNIQGGGQTFDTNSFDVTIAQGMTGVGGLTKSGAGTLTVSGANVYAGATLVQAGTLLVGGSVGGSSLSVQNGGTLSLQNFSSLNDAIVLNLFAGSTVNLNFTGTETIGTLSFNGSSVAPGTYSLAALQGLGGGSGVAFGGDSNAFVTVTSIPEPSTIALVGMAGLAIAARFRRSRVS